MSQKFEKLKNLLKELFQLDHPDLDFGLYRIMHAKAAEVTQFLEHDLLPQVKEEFSKYKTADKAEFEQQLAKAIEQAQALGADPESLPKVKELRGKLAEGAVDLNSLESEVYDHLYSFFRRYYSEGDFLSKRVYKPGVYAIPYEGEEVKLHWANADQYYIKTSEYLRDYAFRLHPDDDANPMRVHFRLIDAAEGEHGNAKAAEGKDRIFILSVNDFIAEEDGERGKELVIRFEYRPATITDWPEEVRDSKKKPPTQKDITSLAETRIAAVNGKALQKWITELGKPHEKADGERADYSRLHAHLNRYVGRSTFDYFIHKDLGAFLRRELDFYIKNEVMHLDDIESESVLRVEQYLSKIKVIRRIAGKLIAFLAQLEDFQKKLWLKKKLVAQTSYLATIDNLPLDLLASVANNDAQINEWVALFGIDQVVSDLTQPGFSRPLRSEFLSAHSHLVVDTRHFPEPFTAMLLDHFSSLETQSSGTLIHSENIQALGLIHDRYREQVRFIYLDPPYNTGDDGFLYKDNYQHSTWATLMEERLAAARDFLTDDGSIAISIDQEEIGCLKAILEQVFGRSNFLSIITVKRGSVTGHKAINPGVVNISEYVVLYAKNRSKWIGNDVYSERDRDTRYSTFIPNVDEPEDRWRFHPLLDAFSEHHQLDRNQLRERFADCLEEELVKFIGDHSEKVVRLADVNLGGVGEDFRAAVEVSKKAPDSIVVHRRSGFPDVHLFNGQRILFYKNKMQRIADRMITVEKASDIWLDVLPNDLHNEGGVSLKKGKKPESLISRLIAMTSDEGDIVMDFFCGTGTTAAVAQKMRRKWVAIDCAPYFWDKTVLRIKNVLGGEQRGVSRAFSWISGGVVRVQTLESYEDALNNLVPPKRTKAQQTLLNSTEAKGANKLREHYFLQYMLNVETDGSQSLLNVHGFIDPTAYRLKVKRPGSDESREVNIDLLETLNWLIGLTVQHIAVPQCFEAKFERDSENRLRLKERLKQVDSSDHWFRTVTGTTPDGRKALVIWRKRPGSETPEGVEQDNLVLDEWFTRQGYSSKDSEFDLIYVNGTNNLENLRTPDDTWKVRLIEDDFHRLMFASESV